MNLYEFHTNPENLLYIDTIQETHPSFFFTRYRKTPTELKKREKYIALEPEYAHKYARFVLEGPFPAGEDAIARSAEYSVKYAKTVIFGPFPKGEKSIAESDIETNLWSDMYTSVIKKDFYYNDKLIAKA